MSNYKRRSWYSRDYQRSKVYCWQYNLEIGRDKLSDTEIDNLIKEVCDVYGLPEEDRPTWIYNRRLKAKSQYRLTNNTIELAPRWGNMALVVLHEIVHAVQWKLDLRDCWHGPIFVGMFSDVMEMFLEKSEVSPTVAACRQGIDIIENPETLSS
jgi:predicted SprT family Zn-dependent metalloprotease